MQIRFPYNSYVFIYIAFSHLLFIFLLQKPQGESPAVFAFVSDRLPINLSHGLIPIRESDLN